MPTPKKTTAPSTPVRSAKRAKGATATASPAARPAAIPAPAALPPAATIVQKLLSATSGASIADLAEQAGLSRTTASKALTALDNAGTARREGGGRDGAHRAPDQWFAIAGANDAAPPAPAQPINVTTQPEPLHDASAAPGGPDCAQQPSADGDRDAPRGDDTPAQGEPEPAPSGEPAPAHDPQPAAGAIARPAKPVKKGTATPAAPAAQTGGDDRRLPKGGLRTMVAEHLAGNPELEITASKLGKLLDRSSGAVANALDKLIEQGAVEQVGTKPRTFRHLGAPTGV